jgi:hypothetical protein
MINTFVEFYKNIRNPSSNKISTIEKQFVECQKKIIKVVEFRKDLSQSYFVDQIKREYCDSLIEVKKQFEKYEEAISHLVKQCHIKNNEILKLQTDKLKMQSYINSELKRGDSNELRLFTKIQENVRELKDSINTWKTSTNQTAALG